MPDKSEIKKLWLKRAALVLLGPILVFGALESVLKVCNFGDPAGFFQQVDVGGRQFTVENPYFGQRFFRRHLPRTPAWNLVESPRADVPRIAIIGESAAQGYPLQKIGLASMLEAILEAEYPGREFDFINASMTSVNSHVLAEVVPEIVSLRPDVTVIYMGNNEVVGPYGPGTPFTAWTRARLFVWLDKKLRATRSYQMLERVISIVVPPPRLKWEGFQMFSQLRVAAESPSLETVYDAFRRNLEAMVSELLDGGSKVVLCTVAVNLADWGPSGSADLPADFPAGKLLAEGKIRLQRGDTANAIEVLGHAAAAAPGNAEIAFCLGKALQKSGRFADARAAFEKARDLDEHRFRADSRINEIIRSTAAKYDGRGVVLLDADKLLDGDSLPDRRYFTEHVHMTFEGMHRLGSLVAGVLPGLLPSLGVAQRVAAVQDADLRHRVFFTPFDELLLASVARDVGAIEIFRDRPGAEETASYLRAREEELRAGNALDAAQLLREYESSMRASGPDARADASLADYLSRLGDTAGAAEAGRRVLQRKPNYFEGFRFQADDAKRRGDSAAAERLYRQALGIYRLIPDAWKNLGDLLRSKGESVSAKDAYAKALRLDARNVPAALALAGMEANGGDRQAARRILDLARADNPDSAPVCTALARLSASEGDNSAARRHYEQALGLDPLLSPREFLRFASESLGAPEQKEIFAACEQRFGGEADLYNNFAWLLATSPAAEVRDPAAALRLARKAVELTQTPNAYYFGTLAAAEAANGNFDDALSALSRARRLSGHDDALLESADRMESAFRGGRPFFDTR